MFVARAIAPPMHDVDGFATFAGRRVTRKAEYSLAKNRLFTFGTATVALACGFSGCAATPPDGQPAAICIDYYASERLETCDQVLALVAKLCAQGIGWFAFKGTCGKHQFVYDNFGTFKKTWYCDAAGKVVGSTETRDLLGAECSLPKFGTIPANCDVSVLAQDATILCKN